MKKGTSKRSRGRAKNIKEKKEKKAKNPMQKAQRTVARPNLKRSSPARSGDAIKVSARDGQSYADILREMKKKKKKKSCPGQSRKKRSCLSCAWHWTERYLTGPAGSSPALVG